MHLIMSSKINFLPLFLLFILPSILYSAKYTIRKCIIIFTYWMKVQFNV